jgi:hypothetical protein
MRGGSEPTIAPTNVFQGLVYFIGRYTHKYDAQTALDITHVYGANWEYAMNEATDRPVPMKHPALELIAPLTIGLFRVLTIN